MENVNLRMENVNLRKKKLRKVCQQSFMIWIRDTLDINSEIE